MTKKTILRPAAAMIELIFAIVVIGITLMQAPTLIAQANKSATVAYLQESIAIAASHTSQLLTYAWDEQNTDLYNMNILGVAGGDSKLDPKGAGAVRGATGAPSPLADFRVRRFNPVDAPMATAALGLDGVEIVGKEDDIDDFNGETTTLTLENNHSTNLTQDGGYIDTNITIATAINYSADTANYENGTSFIINNISDADANTTTNIKYVTTTLTTNSTAEELNKRIILKAFICNIGSARLESRTGI